MLWNDETKKFVNAGEPATKLDDPCLQGLTITPGEVISRIDKARGRGGRLDLTGIGPHEGPGRGLDPDGPHGSSSSATTRSRASPTTSATCASWSGSVWRATG
jgi:hypothetical protein